MSPPVEEFWALVAELEAARQRGLVTLLGAVAQVYPADQAVAAVLAEEAALWAASRACPPAERARSGPARSGAGPGRAVRLLPDREQDLPSWFQAQRKVSDPADQGLARLLAQAPLAALRPGSGLPSRNPSRAGRPNDGALL